MLDLTVNIPQAFLKDLLRRLDRLLEILEHHWPTPTRAELTQQMDQAIKESQEPKRQPEVFSVSDEDLALLQDAEDHFKARVLRDPTPEEIIQEADNMREAGMI